MSGVLLRVEGVSKSYALPRPHILAPRRMQAAVIEASFTLDKGEILGVVGESGSGKSTLSRMVMAFERPDIGRVAFEGRDLAELSQGALKALRPKFQMVFQDAFASLDPRRPIGWSVAEPLLEDRTLDRRERAARALQVLDLVGLRASDAQKYPHEFSGGQRQRIAIARAISSRPALLVADEPVASLDVSVQAQILNLLMDLQEELGLSILFVSHDLAVIASLCDRVLVMQAGRIVEAGPVTEVVGAPKHDYTRALFAGDEDLGSE